MLRQLLVRKATPCWASKHLREEDGSLTSATSWKMAGSSPRHSFTQLDFWVLAFAPQNREESGRSWRPYVEIFRRAEVAVRAGGLGVSLRVTVNACARGHALPTCPPTRHHHPQWHLAWSAWPECRASGAVHTTPLRHSSSVPHCLSHCF